MSENVVSAEWQEGFAKGFRSGLEGSRPARRQAMSDREQKLGELIVRMKASPYIPAGNWAIELEAAIAAETEQVKEAFDARAWLQQRIDWHEVQATMADATDYIECVPFHDKQKAALEIELKYAAGQAAHLTESERK